MKNLKNLFIYIITISFITSCDVIDPPYSVTTTGSNTGNDSAVMRKVLLEDYTGHKCQGCPNAHIEANNLKNFFGDSVVLITIHAGYFATYNSAPFTYNFTTNEGDAIYNELIPSTQPFPTGTVNRKFYGSQRIVDYPKWGGKIDTLLNKPPDAQIKISPSWDPATRMISGNFKSTFLKNISGDIALSVLYTEDSIVNWQAFPLPTGNVSNYIHRHVLRGSLNGAWGSVISVNPVQGNVVYKDVTSSPIAADIIPQQVYIVAFLFDNATKEVIQAEEVKLLP